MMRSDDTAKPQLTRKLLLRVLSYARAYRAQIIGMLVMILITTGLSLLTPLIFRRMIDVVIPHKDLKGLTLLALALLMIPVLGGIDRHPPAPVERRGGRGRDLRPARGAVCQAGAHVAAVLHQHPDRAS